jgi:hypothetical protein
MEKRDLHALPDLDSIAIWSIAHGKMERARITLITARRGIITETQHLIRGCALRILIKLPHKIVAITMNLTEVARLAIDQENILLVVTIGLGLAPTNRVCAFLMSSMTMNTNTVTSRTGLTK